MPKRPSNIEGKVLPVPCDGPEHVVRYERLQQGAHYADIMRDKRTYPEVYHCVIQQEGSNEIHSWTQHSSLDAAVRNAKAALTLISRSSEGKGQTK